MTQLPLIDVYQFARLRAIASGPFSFRWAGKNLNYKLTYADNDIRVTKIEDK
mgnify:CR=1 FL=1|jgi:hypothetical protein